MKKILITAILLGITYPLTLQAKGILLQIDGNHPLGALLQLIMFGAIGYFIYWIINKGKRDNKKYLERKAREEADLAARRELISAEIKSKIEALEDENRNIIDDLAANTIDTDNIIYCELAGLYHRNETAHEVARSLNVGAELELKLDPSNPYDPFAVKIMYKNTHLGFVPQEYSEKVFTQFKNKIRYFTFVYEITENDIPYIDLKLIPREGRYLKDY